MFAAEELKEILEVELLFMGYELEEPSRVNEMNSRKCPLGFGRGRLMDKEQRRLHRLYPGK